MGEIGLNIVCEEVFNAAKRSKEKKIRNDAYEENDMNLTTLEPSAFDIYQAVVVLLPRLQLCNDVFNLVEDLKTKFQKLKVSQTFNLDIEALNWAFDLMNPSGSDLLNNDVKTLWSNKVARLSTFVKRLEVLLSKEQVSDEDQALITSIKSKCRQAEIMKLFISHILQNDVNVGVKKTVCSNIRLLFVAIKDPEFFHGPKTFKRVQMAIANCCKRVGETFMGFNGVQQCIVCLETITEPAILPCDHIGCRQCLVDYIKVASTRICPKNGCKETVPDDFKLRCPDELKHAVKEHTKFRQKLTRFFVEMLQRFVFVDERMPHQDVVDDLLSLVVTKKLPKDETKPRTKQLSPFPGDFIDAQPVIRSFILQLLLKYDVHYIEPHLQKFMSEKAMVATAENHFPELCALIVHCFEDSFATKLIKRTGDCVKGIKAATKYMKTRLEHNFDAGETLVRSLLNTAQDRLAMTTVASSINDFLIDRADEEKISDLMKTASDFAKFHPESDNIRKLVVRLIATSYQISAVVEWKKKGILLDLLPEDLRNTAGNDVPDVFLTVDRNYKPLRDAISHAWLSGNLQEVSNMIIEHANDPKLWTLAFHHLTKVNPVNRRHDEAFDVLLQEHKWLKDLWTKNNAESYMSLVGKTHVHTAIQTLLVHFATILKDTKMSHFFDIFRLMTKTPQNCGHLYLPTMPQDEAMEVKAAIVDATTWFKCPNCQAAYAIGNCGQPVEAGKCPGCGSLVGGQRYAFAGTGHNVTQVQQAVFNDSTKPGHTLDEAIPNSRSTRVRDISGLAVAVVRFLLHSSMLEGCEANPKGVAGVITPQPKDVSQFLVDHLLMNLKQISDCLGKSENDVIILLHHIIERCSKMKFVEGNWNLNTKTTTRLWESKFVKEFLDPALRILDTSLASHQVAVKEDTEEASCVLQDILFEPPGTTNDRSKILSLPQFWFPRTNISIDRLILFFTFCRTNLNEHR